MRLGRVKQKLLYLTAASRSLNNHTQETCYSSATSIPARGKSIHIELKLDLQAEKLATEESIKHVQNEVQINPPRAPIFLAILCQAGLGQTPIQPP